MSSIQRGNSAGSSLTFRIRIGSFHDAAHLFNPSSLFELKPLLILFVVVHLNQYALLNLPEIRQQIAITQEHSNQIQVLLKKADEDVRVVRRKTLKDADSDFAELKDDEKVRLVQTILANAKFINVEANRKVLKVLNADQINILHKSLVRRIGVRAIDSESIGLMTRPHLCCAPFSADH